MNQSMQQELLQECQEDAVRWTQELVKIPSENPPGSELACAQYCAELLTALGMEVHLDPFAPGRANVVAYAGNRDELGIVLNGHIDTVPANEGWHTPPFSAAIHDGCIWGRGSADMKSGCAAMMAAAKYILQSGIPYRRGLALTFVSDEECRNAGAERMLQTVSLSADACIVCEPTQLQIHYGNRGFTSFYIRTHGKSCHGCEPGNGENAIYKMAGVLTKLEKFAHKLESRTNPQLGKVTLSTGVIRGGLSLNMVPDLCEIEVESRVFPGMDAESMRKELQEELGDAAEVVVRSNLLASLVAEDSEIVQNAACCIAQTLGRKAVVDKFPACSEASYFSVKYGIPTILLGPGDIGCAHKPNEFVPVSEVKQAVEIYTRMMQCYMA